MSKKMQRGFARLGGGAGALVALLAPSLARAHYGLEKTLGFHGHAHGLEMPQTAAGWIYLLAWIFIAGLLWVGSIRFYLQRQPGIAREQWTRFWSWFQRSKN